MRTISINKIKLNDNIRDDYGDLTELVASIKEHGLKNPVEINKKYELVDGHRRLIAAEKAGLQSVPYFFAVNKNLDSATSQVLSGIFQKKLNAVEESKAFQKLIDSGMSIQSLADRISKKEIYIKRRLELANVSREIKNALVKGKIELGHALLLGKISEKSVQKKFLKDVIADGDSVQGLKNTIDFNFSAKLKNAHFSKRTGLNGDGKGTTGCSGCPYNGSEQSELFEDGALLTGQCMKPSCFSRKTAARVKELKEKYKDVLFKGNDWESPTGYCDGRYDYTRHGVTNEYKKKCRKERKGYLVYVRSTGELVEFFYIPGRDVSKTNANNIDDLEKKEKSLLAKAQDHKEQFLRRKIKESLRPGTYEAKALCVLKLIQEADSYEVDAVSHKYEKFSYKGCGDDEKIIKNIFSSDGEELDHVIEMLSRSAVNLLSARELSKLAEYFDVSMQEHFRLNEDYLKLYTKDQLMQLINELELEKPETDLKKKDLMMFILEQDTTGKIPKIIS